jgi:DNA-binding MarR family transcriptional regulator
LEEPLFQQLPFYITATFKVRETTIYEQRICLLIAENSETILPPDRLFKQMAFVRQKVGFPVVYVFEKVISYNINRMIQKGINFVIPGKQLFIPALVMDLRTTPQTFPQNAVRFTPLAQFLILYHLQKEGLSNYTAKQLTDKFSQPYRSISRAVNNLSEFGICNLTGGKEKYVQFTAKGKKLWKLAQAFFQNPVERILFTDKALGEKQACISNINALSHFTMINDENKRYYAIGKNDTKNIDVETNRCGGDNIIELWRYNPYPLSNDGFVDKLSLFLLLKQDTDERIQSELEKMINQMKWLEE